MFLSKDIGGANKGLEKQFVSELVLHFFAKFSSFFVLMNIPANTKKIKLNQVGPLKTITKTYNLISD